MEGFAHGATFHAPQFTDPPGTDLGNTVHGIFDRTVKFLSNFLAKFWAPGGGPGSAQGPQNGPRGRI